MNIRLTQCFLVRTVHDDEHDGRTTEKRYAEEGEQNIKAENHVEGQAGHGLYVLSDLADLLYVACSQIYDFSLRVAFVSCVRDL